MAPSLFSFSFAEARHRFVEGATRSGWHLDSHRRNDQSRTEDLWTDVARFGPHDAEGVLLISSGLHGVEGYLGSAIQLALLEAIPPIIEAAPNVGIVLVHAVNPYGFHHDRRFDEANVDLNRNFLPVDEAYSGCPALYRRLDPFLNPRRVRKWEVPFRLQAAAVVLRYGLAPLQQAIASGQYEFPQGLFFGGSASATTHHFWKEHWPSWCGSARRVVHFDIHTGLGGRRDVRFLWDYDLDEAETEWLAETFPTAFEPPTERSSGAYHARGSINRWCRLSASSQQVLSLCLEFGTYDPITVLAALRRENAAHHFLPADSVGYQRAKAQLREAFCPSDGAWREHAIMSGRSLCEQGVTSLPRLLSH